MYFKVERKYKKIKSQSGALLWRFVRYTYPSTAVESGLMFLNLEKSLGHSHVGLLDLVSLVTDCTCTMCIKSIFCEKSKFQLLYLLA